MIAVIKQKKVPKLEGEIETGKFEPQTPETKATDTSDEPEQAVAKKLGNIKYINRILKRILKHPIKSIGSVFLQLF